MFLYVLLKCLLLCRVEEEVGALEAILMEDVKVIRSDQG